MNIAEFRLKLTLLGFNPDPNNDDPNHWIGNQTHEYWDAPENLYGGIVWVDLKPNSSICRMYIDDIEHLEFESLEALDIVFNQELAKGVIEEIDKDN